MTNLAAQTQQYNQKLQTLGWLMLTVAAFCAFGFFVFSFKKYMHMLSVERTEVIATALMIPEILVRDNEELYRAIEKIVA